MSRKKKNRKSKQKNQSHNFRRILALGTIRINHSVIAGIVRLATQSVDGVVNVGGGGVVEGLTISSRRKNPKEA